MGSWVRDETGGEGFEDSTKLGGLGSGRSSGEAGGESGGIVEERETVFVVVAGLLAAEGGFRPAVAVLGDFFGGRPEITGGGRSRPSAAFRDSCLAKSLACHHSKNFRAKMLVGKRNLKLDNNFGYSTRPIVAGFKILLFCPGRAPGLPAEDACCSASVMAR